jgi:pimeloyl-ACP methyl ester carboxylesterase
MYRLRRKYRLREALRNTYDDLVTSTRFADRMNGSISGAELENFEACAHAPIYEKVDEFNRKTLAFLQRQAA